MTKTKDSSGNNCAILDADASRLASFAPHLHTPGMRARRALPSGRLDAQNDTLIPGRILIWPSLETLEVSARTGLGMDAWLAKFRSVSILPQRW